MPPPSSLGLSSRALTCCCAGILCLGCGDVTQLILEVAQFCSERFVLEVSAPALRSLLPFSAWQDSVTHQELNTITPTSTPLP